MDKRAQVYVGLPHRGWHARGGDLAAEGLDGREVDLRERRERLDRVYEHVERRLRGRDHIRANEPYRFVIVQSDCVFLK